MFWSLIINLISLVRHMCYGGGGDRFNDIADYGVMVYSITL